MSEKLNDKKQFYISSSPHFSANLTTTKIMACVLIALLPEVIFGIVTFGLPAFVTIFVSVIGAVGFEALYQIITKQKVVATRKRFFKSAERILKESVLNRLFLF